MGNLGYHEFEINETFKNLIPPLSHDEYDELVKSLETDGCITPIIVWNNTIIDGHNRYEICKKLNIPFEYIELQFENEELAKIWMCRNQLGRRNITDETRKYLIGKRFESEKVIGAKNYRGFNQFKSSENCVLQPSVLLNPETNSEEMVAESSRNKTAKRIAKDYNISHASVDKYAIYARAIDEIDAKVPGMARKIMTGKLKISHEHIKEISKLKPEQIKKLFSTIDDYGEHTRPGIIRREFTKVVPSSKSKNEQILTAEVKKQTQYNPDSELMSLYFTVPSWYNSINSTAEKIDFDIASIDAKKKLIGVLNELEESINTIVNKLMGDK